MGGGNIHRNHNNMQETDEEMLHKIQRIDTIKFNPNHWHLDMLSPTNWYNISGGAPTLVSMAIGSLFSYSYYANGARHMPYNFYMHNMKAFSRIAVGAAVGLAYGYMRFGDRQTLHNAWVSERLRRRYPDCMKLNEHDLWQLKGEKANHEFYRWV